MGHREKERGRVGWVGGATTNWLDHESFPLTHRNSTVLIYLRTFAFPSLIPAAPPRARASAFFHRSMCLGYDARFKYFIPRTYIGTYRYLEYPRFRWDTRHVQFSTQALSREKAEEEHMERRLSVGSLGRIAVL